MYIRNKNSYKNYKKYKLYKKNAKHYKRIKFYKKNLNTYFWVFGYMNWVVLNGACVFQQHFSL